MKINNIEELIELTGKTIENKFTKEMFTIDEIRINTLLNDKHYFLCDDIKNVNMGGMFSGVIDILNNYEIIN